MFLFPVRDMATGLPVYLLSGVQVLSTNARPVDSLRDDLQDLKGGVDLSAGFAACF